MWKLILLFILLTPGILFTIPPYGKKFIGGNGNLVTAVLHGILFVFIAQFFMIYNEGFTVCPSNQRKNASGICLLCPSGSYCNGTNASTCPPGYYCTNGNKNKCDRGKYNSQSGRTSCQSCNTNKCIACFNSSSAVCTSATQA